MYLKLSDTFVIGENGPSFNKYGKALRVERATRPFGGQPAHQLPGQLLLIG